jgi:RecB family exonuclease
MSYSPSPLIPELRAAQVRAARTTGAGSNHRADWEVLDDECGVALPAGAKAHGGEATFAAQAACPFRAYARYRLLARELEQPQPGLAAVERGSALHRALANLWSQLRDHSALCALTPAARSALIESAVSAAVPPRAGATALEQTVDAVERERLANLIEAWLAVEAERLPFTVLAVEAPARVVLGDIAVDVRLDRLDRLADGREVIIDYKTGQADTSGWQPPRLDAPQLPLYAVTAGRAALAAIAFAHVVRAEPALKADASLEVFDPLAWQTRCAAWRADLEQLAHEIKQGVATVAPKHGPATCRTCEQALFCRIDALELDADEGAPGDG